MRRLLPVLAFAVTTAGAGAQILPPPPVPAGNPQAADKALLGKALFWDEQLSSTRSVACGTCHVFGHGGGDPRASAARHPGSDGIFGTADDVHGSPGVVRHERSGAFALDPVFGLQAQVTARKAPSVVNAAYAVTLFADGRADGLFVDPVGGAVVLPAGGAIESQIAAPPVNTTEMSHLGRTWSDIAADLQNLTPLALATNVPPVLQQFVAGQTYAALFQQVYGSPGVTPVRIVFAIAAYERTLISDRSPFDLFLAGQGSLTALEQAGLLRFQQLCAGCHTDVLPAVLAAGPVLDDYRNIGVRPLVEDQGRSGVTFALVDRGKFRVPGLRNVALRAPYFHNGGMPTLGAVIDFYARGGDFHDNQDRLVVNIAGHVSIADRIGIEALLQTLTDPRVQNELPPFDRPRLWSEGPLAPTVFGHGSAGSGAPAPRSAVATPAFRGNDRFALGVDRTTAGVLALLGLDVSRNAVPTAIAGHDVWLGLSPALVGVGPVGTQDGGAGGGYAVLVQPVPATAIPIGAVFYGQWLVLDPAGPGGFTTSDAFGFTVF